MIVWAQGGSAHPLHPSPGSAPDSTSELNTMGQANASLTLCSRTEWCPPWLLGLCDMSQEFYALEGYKKTN